MRRHHESLTVTAITTLSVLALGFVSCSDDEGGGQSQDAGAFDAAEGPDAGDAGDTGGEPTSRSPDWSEQIIYFVMIDRFANGDPSNDDQGAGEYDPTRNSHFSGGDLRGIIEQLDYIEGLGATAIWITPPVANQWWDPVVDFGGYHGYWARHHKEVDEHFGDLATYQELADALHARGMYLIQDIVPNHVGNFFYYQNESYNPDDVTEGFRLNTETVPTTRPEQAPFDQNDVTNPDHREAAIYHWTPTIRDFSVQEQEYNFQLSNLDDLNTENPVVREALKDSFGYWIEEVGVDGFRVDTTKFIPHDFWRDFIHGPGGVEEVAESTQRDDFLTFGEVFEVSAPFRDSGEQKAISFLGTEAEPELKAVIQFPLYEEISNVFAEGSPTRQMSYRLEKFMELFPNPYITPTFLDNHDVPRFLTSGNVAALEQALTLLMTVPGIPVIYYGTEQLFDETRETMFGGGFGAPSEDRFDPESEMYAFIEGLSGLRRSATVLTRGSLSMVGDNAAGPGLLAYERKLNDDRVLVVFNTADETVLVPNLETGLPSGAELELLTNRRVDEAPQVGLDGRILTELSARAILVARPTGETSEVPTPAATITVDTDVTGPVHTEDIVLAGTVEPADAELVAVVDGLLDRAVTASVSADGAWTATLALDEFPLGESSHSVAMYAPTAKVASPSQTFTVDVQFDGVVVEKADPLGDDHGPTGGYEYPGDSTFDREMDIEQMTVEAGGVTMRVRLLMRQMKYIWAQANGFDHVSFTLFFDAPEIDRDLAVLPQLQTTAPSGFGWDFMNVISLQSNDMYSSEGASATARGAPLNAAPTIEADLPRRTVTFTYNRNALGLSSWEGVRIYVTTWDIDGISGEYRAIDPEGGDWTFRGPADGAKIMDDIGPVTVPPIE